MYLIKEFYTIKFLAGDFVGDHELLENLSVHGEKSLLVERESGQLVSEGSDVRINDARNHDLTRRLKNHTFKFHS